MRLRPSLATLFLSLAGLLLPNGARAQDSGLGLDLSDEPKKDEPAAKPAKPPPDTPPDNPPSGDATPGEGGPTTPAKPGAGGNAVGEKDATLEDRVKSVAKRQRNKKGHFELEPHAGVSLNDPFYTKFALGAEGDFHFADALALGIRANYLLVQESGNVPTAKRELHSRLPVANPTWDAALNFQWVPVYAKASLFNSIIQFDNILIGGVGLVSSQTSSSPNNKIDPRLNEGLHPSVEIGLGQRYPLNDLFAFEWKVMETLYNDIPGGSGPATLERMTTVYAGLAIFLPPIHSND
jgi:outer membrane beta-barrel protein